MKKFAVISEYELISSQMYELRTRSSLSHEARIRIVDELISHVHKTLRTQPLTEQVYCHIFHETAELLDPAQSFDIRKRIWKFYTQLVQRKAETLGQFRYYLFELVNKYESKIDELELKIDFLVAITENGKDIRYYEAEFAAFIIDLLTSLMEKKPTGQEVILKKLAYPVRHRFLDLLNNLIKFNSSHLGFESSSALVQIMNYVCLLAYESNSNVELENVYKFLQDATCYSHLPSDCLNQLIMVLCVGVNKREFEPLCQQIMGQLIGSFLGYASLSTLLYIIEDQTNYSDKVLIRGAVHFLILSIWEGLGQKHKLADGVESSKLSPNEVLPALKNIILNDSIACSPILLEIASGVLNFLKKAPDQQSPIKTEVFDENFVEQQIRLITYAQTWDLVLDICYVLVQKGIRDQPIELRSMVQLLIETLNSLLHKIYWKESTFLESEILLTKAKFTDKVFAILELDIRLLSDESLVKLIGFRFSHIYEHEKEWASVMYTMIEVYYNPNVSLSIRKQFLGNLQEFLDINSRLCDADRFWEEVASHFFSPNLEILSRELGVEFLIFLALKSQNSKNVIEITDVLDKVASYHCSRNHRHHSMDIGQLNSRTPPISHQNSAPTQSPSGANGSVNDHRVDPLGPIQGMVKIFLAKFDHPGCWQAALHAFRLIIKTYSHMKNAIVEQEMLSHFPVTKNDKQMVARVKHVVLRLILSLRMNSLGQLGVFQPVDLSSHSQQQQQPRNPIKFSAYVFLKKPEHVVELMSPSSAQASPQVAIYQPVTNRTPSTSQELFVCSFFEAFKLVIDCIETEVDWSLLSYVLEHFTKLLKNRALVIFLGSIADVFGLTVQPVNQFLPLGSSTSSSQIGSPISPPPIPMPKKVPETYFSDHLVEITAKIIQRRHDRHKMILAFESLDSKPNMVGFLEQIYKLLTELIGYPLQCSSHSLIIDCFKESLVLMSQRTLCVRHCIVSFTLCLIEMPSAMKRNFRDIISTLCKISANKTLAIPTLQFLSNILLFTELDYTFDHELYMFIMIISQQYINPFKYGEFVVVLALRVISMWYLRCPTPYRFTLIKFLRKGLSSNILKENEQNQKMKIPLQRLSSMSNVPERLSDVPSTPQPGSQTPSAQQTPTPSLAGSMLSTSAGEGLILDPNNVENSKIELVEACMDLFSSITFNTSSPLPMKKSIINKLIDQQKSMYWLVGHKIIQITTTGCLSRAWKRNGLCQKCFYECHLNEKEEQESSQSSSSSSSQTNMFGSKQVSFQSQLVKSEDGNFPGAKIRRRHKSDGVKKTYGGGSVGGSKVFEIENLLKRNPSSTTNSDPDLKNQFCRCWCQSWAEITVRRATGNSRWIMRVENNLGDFPYWTYSKEDEDTLANIFAHSDSEVAQALKLQKVSETEDLEDFEDVEEIKFKVASEKNVVDESATAENVASTVAAPASLTKSKSSKSVNRASSFGSKIFSSPYNADPEKKNRLEKDFSFEEDDTFSIGGGDNVNNVNTELPQVATPVDFSQQQQQLPSSGRSSAADSYRERSTTISVMSPAQKPIASSGVSSSSFLSARTGSTMSLGQQPSSGALSPQWVFLQLFYNSTFKEVSEISPFEKPILLKKNDQTLSSISMFDLITPYETHKIGVVYIGPGQVASKTEILANQVGSFRYTTFLKELGQLVKLEDVDSKVCYLGGLSKEDGPFAISWGDHLVQAIFHVATLMPNNPKDPKCVSKLRHIGNDFVAIVYNNSCRPYSPVTLRGETAFLKAQIQITPMEHNCNLVEVLARQEFNEFIGHTEPAIISDSALPIYVRQLALHSNLAAMVELQSPTSHINMKSYNISNWITRLRQIKKIRTRHLDQHSSSASNASLQELSHQVRQSSLTAAARTLSSGFGAVQSDMAPTSASLNSQEETFVKLAFPDFTDFTEDLFYSNQSR